MIIFLVGLVAGLLIGYLWVTISLVLHTKIGVLDIDTNHGQPRFLIRLHNNPFDLKRQKICILTINPKADLSKNFSDEPRE